MSRHTQPTPTVAPPEVATPLEPLLSIDGVARILSVSRPTVERMRSGGKLPRPDLHIGRMPRWKPETVRRWIEGGGVL